MSIITRHQLRSHTGKIHIFVIDPRGEIVRKGNCRIGHAGHFVDMSIEKARHVWRCFIRKGAVTGRAAHRTDARYAD